MIKNLNRRWFWVVVLALIAAMVLGFTSTAAWFSSTASSQGNIIASGSLDLSLSENSFDKINLVPGEDYSELGTFCVRNNGTIDLKYRGFFEATESVSHKFIEFLTLKVEKQTPDGWTTLKEITGNPASEPERLIYYFKLPDQDPNAVNQYVIIGNLDPEKEDCYRTSFKLDDTATNDMQDQSMNFDLQIYSTQSDNPGW